MGAENGRRHRRHRRPPAQRSSSPSCPAAATRQPGEDEQLAEIKELLRSADMDWVADVIQHRDSPNPRTYLGKGKMGELKAAIGENAATVAVCEDDLTPAQVASVLDAVDADVLDRTELILTVFSKHAHSLEGTMQVHLAQLEYELTRMRGKGLVMSRLGAGVDMRGPGETKMEVDRRVVRKRIQTLRQPHRPDGAHAPHPARQAPACRRAAHRARRLHQRRQVDAAQRAHRRRGLGARPPLRDARPDLAELPLPRPRLRGHRHRRASSASCRTSSSTPSPARSRRPRWPTSSSWSPTPASTRPRSPCARRRWPTCST